VLQLVNTASDPQHLSVEEMDDKFRQMLHAMQQASSLGNHVRGEYNRMLAYMNILDNRCRQLQKENREGALKHKQCYDEYQRLLQHYNSKITELNNSQHEKVDYVTKVQSERMELSALLSDNIRRHVETALEIEQKRAALLHAENMNVQLEHRVGQLNEQLEGVSIELGDYEKHLEDVNHELEDCKKQLEESKTKKRERFESEAPAPPRKTRRRK